MTDNIIIGLNTIDLRAKPTALNTPLRPFKKRLFTEDEWAFLNTRPTPELRQRIELGKQLIALLYRPEMINIRPKEADMLSSNLQYQIDAIMEIIKRRV